MATTPTASRRETQAYSGPAGRIQHLSAEERSALGKTARAKIPRSLAAAWVPPSTRTPAVDLLEEQAASRVPELVPIRYGRMLSSPFAFFRGAAYVMASDLAECPRTGLDVQLCGDAHLSNFGAFAAPDRRMVFSVNDFDETLPGPFEWDLKRLAASFAIAGRDLGLDQSSRERVCMSVIGYYRDSIRSFAGMRNMDLWYARVEIDEVVRQFRSLATSQQAKRLDRNVAKARTKDSLRAFTKLVQTENGQSRFTAEPPLIVPVEDLVAPDEAATIEERMRRLLRSYRRTLRPDLRRLMERFRYVHMARKVVGVGSVGTRAWIVLMMGRDSGDPLILQCKEAQPSVLEPFLGQSEYSSHGQRVVEGQRLTQASPDIMLGWLRAEGIDGVTRDFYVRQLWDAKGSAAVETMDFKTLDIYARLCGWTLAKAHARSGDAIAIGSYLGSTDTFDRAIAAFSEEYADQNQRDYESLQEAVASGRVMAETGL